MTLTTRQWRMLELAVDGRILYDESQPSVIVGDIQLYRSHSIRAIELFNGTDLRTLRSLIRRRLLVRIKDIYAPSVRGFRALGLCD